MDGGNNFEHLTGRLLKTFPKLSRLEAEKLATQLQDAKEWKFEGNLIEEKRKQTNGGWSRPEYLVYERLLRTSEGILHRDVRVEIISEV